MSTTPTNDLATHIQNRGLSTRFLKGKGLLIVFLLVHTIVSFYYVAHQNITFDEPDYFEYCKRWLHGHPERIIPLDDSKSPIIAFTWLPRIVQQVINPNYELHDYGRQDQKEGRYLMILFSYMIAIYVYKWCRQLYGSNGWQLPLLLLLFDPLYLAYTTLISTNLACAAMLVAVLYHFQRWLVDRSVKHFWITALLTGLAFVTKQNLVFLAAILPMLSFVYHAYHHSLKELISRKSLFNILLFSLVVIVVINCGYYFYHSFKPFGNYVFESKALRSLQQYSLLQKIPVPLPEPYVQSLDMLKAHADLGGGEPGSTYNGVYLFGYLKLKGIFWYYYPVVMFYKMPVGTMLLFVACTLLFFKRFTLRGFINKYMFLLVPSVFYVIIIGFFNQFQSGARHMLLIFPLLFIGLGYLFRWIAHARLAYKIAAAASIVYVFVTVAIYYPYIIPYTNEFITDKKTVYKKIYDSSVDYGQSDSSVHVFMAQHPDYKAAVKTPSVGKYVVPMGQMLNTYLQNDCPYKWYMAFNPKGLYRYSVLLFNITKDDLEHADFSKSELNIIKGDN